ncbi:tetratricopeptide repeat protein [Shewanella vesiculosa]|uniref:tetratricopeptide repeat protein n=1 Tax=Shewanella vesiculosa TaxID=518738 RepID=UPI003D0888FC
MEIYSTEEQQVDAIKQFWKDYGTSIVVGAVVGLGGLYGWNTYSDMKVTAVEKASESFQSIVTQSANPAALLVQAESFTSEHDQQGYQALLELMVAKSAVEAGDLAKAEASFTKVIAAELGSGLGMVAMIRLARIQAEQNNLGMALATLEQVTDKAFASQREELKGDFLVRQGDLDKAKLAYQAAVDNGGAIASPALTMKLDNLNKA